MLLRFFLLGFLIFAPSLHSGEKVPVYVSEFQMWADVRPAGMKFLKWVYDRIGVSHNFMMMSNNQRFWAEDRVRKMVDEAAGMGVFNLFTIGDDHGARKGHIFEGAGINPEYRDFFLNSVRYIHSKGMMAGVEPRNIPKTTNKKVQRRWWRSFLSPEHGAGVVDVIKLSMEWIGGYQHDYRMVRYIDTIIEVVSEVNPSVLVYVDSIGNEWRKVRQAHRYLLGRHPYILMMLHNANPIGGNDGGASVEMVSEFRKEGFRNLMLQINPNEGSQCFYFVDRTRMSVRNFIELDMPFVSFAGANLGYDRKQLERIVSPLRSKLFLVKNIQELRSKLVFQEIQNPVVYEDVVNQELLDPLGPTVGMLHTLIVNFN